MSTPQPQAAPQKQGRYVPKEAPRITDAFFKDAAPFSSETMTANVGRNGVESLIPGCVDSAGRVSTALDDGERPSDGLLVTYRQRQADGTSVIRMCLVPWSNIRGVSFGDVEVPAPQAA